MARIVEETRETVVNEPTVATERTVVTERPAVATTPAVVEPVESRAAQIIYLILTIVEILLAFRLVLRLLGANSVSTFVNLIYAITYPLIYPFIGIFSVTDNFTVASFELATLVAMAVYAVVAYIIVALIRISRTKSRA